MKLKECLQNKTDDRKVLENIALNIKRQYDFNMYEISKDKIKEMSLIILRVGIKYNITTNQIEDFFNELKEGKFGTLYKMPSDMISKFWKYNDQKIVTDARTLYPDLNPKK